MEKRIAHLILQVEDIKMVDEIPDFEVFDYVVEGEEVTITAESSLFEQDFILHDLIIMDDGEIELWPCKKHY